MTIGSDIISTLQSKKLTPDLALEIYNIVDRHTSSLPRPLTEAIFHSIREHLVVYSPPRRIDAKRLFCTPFEDLLISEDPDAKTPRKIARASIEPIWNLVREHLGSKKMKDLSVDAELVTNQSVEDDGGIGERWWPILAVATREIAQKSADDRNFRIKISEVLDKQTRLADLREMAEALENWEMSRIVRSTIPKGSSNIPDATLDKIANIVNECMALGATEIIEDIALARISNYDRRRALAFRLEGPIDRVFDESVNALTQRFADMDSVAKMDQMVVDMNLIVDRSEKKKPKSFEAGVGKIGATVWSFFEKGPPEKQVSNWVRILKAGLKLAVFESKHAGEIRDFLNQMQIDIEKDLRSHTVREDAKKDTVYFELLRTYEEIAGAEVVNKFLIRDGLKPNPDGKKTVAA